MEPERATRGLRRLWPLAALAVAVLALFGAGGFERRTDQLVPAALGAEVDSHNLVFTFTSGTLQSVTDFSGDQDWRIVLAGTVRNPNDEALAPITGAYGNFIVHDPVSRLTAEPEGVQIGDSDHRGLVPPGDTTFDLRVTFTLPEQYRPAAGIELGVFPMEYTDNVILGLGGGSRTWNVDSHAPAALLQVPLERLPDQAD